MSPERVYVGLGANLGDARETIAQALVALAALPQTRVVACSALYRSAPVEALGPHFMNAVAELSTALEPEPLLRALHEIEQAHGRERPFPNAPRTLDLDLLLYGQRATQDPQLTLKLPHPRLHLRAFVLLPLLELAPDLAPLGLGPLRDWAQRAGDQIIERLS